MPYGKVIQTARIGHIFGVLGTGYREPVPGPLSGQSCFSYLMWPLIYSQQNSANLDMSHGIVKKNRELTTFSGSSEPALGTGSEITKRTMLSSVAGLMTGELSMKFCEFRCAIRQAHINCENWPHFRGPGNRFRDHQVANLASGF